MNAAYCFCGHIEWNSFILMKISFLIIFGRKYVSSMLFATEVRVVSAITFEFHWIIHLFLSIQCLAKCVFLNICSVHESIDAEILKSISLLRSCFSGFATDWEFLIFFMLLITIFMFIKDLTVEYRFLCGLEVVHFDIYVCEGCRHVREWTN